MKIWLKGPREKMKIRYSWLDNVLKTFHCIIKKQQQKQNSYQKKHGHFHLNLFQVMASTGAIWSFSEKCGRVGNGDGAFGGNHIT